MSTVNKIPATPNGVESVNGAPSNSQNPIYQDGEIVYEANQAGDVKRQEYWHNYEYYAQFGVTPEMWENELFRARLLANPYFDFRANENLWDKFGNTIGFNTKSDREQNDAMLKERQYISDLIGEFQTYINSLPKTQSQQLKAAGINPDLQGGVTPSSFAASNVGSAGGSPAASADDFGSIFQVAANAIGGVFGGMLNALNFFTDYNQRRTNLNKSKLENNKLVFDSVMSMYNSGFFSDKHGNTLPVDEWIYDFGSKSLNDTFSQVKRQFMHSFAFDKEAKKNKVEAIETDINYAETEAKHIQMLRVFGSESDVIQGGDDFSLNPLSDAYTELARCAVELYQTQSEVDALSSKQELELRQAISDNNLITEQVENDALNAKVQKYNNQLLYSKLQALEKMQKQFNKFISTINNTDSLAGNVLLGLLYTANSDMSLGLSQMQSVAKDIGQFIFTKRAKLPNLTK